MVFRYDLTRDGKAVQVEVEIDTSGPLFDRLVRYLVTKAADSKTGVAKIAHGVIRAKVVR